MESQEQKIEKLRTERQEALRQKYLTQEFYINKTGGLSRYGWGDNIFYVGMLVKVYKPDKTTRRGEIESISIGVDGLPKIIVVCGKNKVKFEKTWGQLFEDKTILQIVEWEKIEVPERIRKMDTFKLLTEFRKRKKSIRNTDEEMIYKKELYLREHVGNTNAPVQKRKRQLKFKSK